MTTTPMTDAELSPCPFCAAVDCRVQRHGQTSFVACDNCLCRGPGANDGETARQLWIRRVQTQSTSWLDHAQVGRDEFRGMSSGT